MHDLHDHLQDISRGINWTYVLAGIGMIAGSITWSIRKVFTTHEDMIACKREVLHHIEQHEYREEKKYEEMATQHDRQHAAIWEDIKWIKAFLIEHGPPHD